MSDVDYTIKQTNGGKLIMISVVDSGTTDIQIIIWEDDDPKTQVEVKDIDGNVTSLTLGIDGYTTRF